MMAVGLRRPSGGYSVSERLLFDFDETLFDHIAMLTWLDRTMAEQYGLEPGEFAASIDEHHTQLDEIHRLYRHREHYGMSGLDWVDVSPQIAEMIAEQELDFCYPDVHPVLGRVAASGVDVGLLTFGDEEYQLFKIAQCRELERYNFPIYVVREPKRDFLAREFPGGGTLVDDKFPLGLPETWSHVLIDRGERFARTSLGKRVMRITTLAELNFAPD
jgi:hypothetical protein